jgi:hypothetical protein
LLAQQWQWRYLNNILVIAHIYIFHCPVGIPVWLRKNLAQLQNSYPTASMAAIPV